MINSNDILHKLKVAIEDELRVLIQNLEHTDTLEYFRMVEYHMGVSEENFEFISRGKRIRPTITMLCSDPEYSSDKWKYSLPAAAAIELLHNFSLIHDDIQDNSETRRNRPTVWKKWGIPQAINAGDGIFSLANIALEKLLENYTDKIIVQIMIEFNQVCLDLTKGQYMDIAFQDKQDVQIDEYWTMINYKTARLLSTSAEIGAILADVQPEDLRLYRDFGKNLGLAFQIKDDILGIWGIEDKTGKSATTDLETSKKTLPVIYGLNKSEKFTTRWIKGNISPEEAIKLAFLLDQEGAREYSEEFVRIFITNALMILDNLPLLDDNKQALIMLSNDLLKRET